MNESRTSEAPGSGVGDARPLAQAPRRQALVAVTLLLTLAIFLVDILSPLEGAVAVLYVVVVLLAGRTSRRRGIILAAGGTMALTVVAYVDSHGLNHVGSPTIRALVSLAAIGITAALSLQSQSATAAVIRSESRYRRIFDASRIGIVQEDWSRIRDALGKPAPKHAGAFADLAGRDPTLVARMRSMATIVGVNPAMLAMLGHRNEAPFVAGEERLLMLSDGTFAEILEAFAGGEPFYEGESEVLRGDGGRVPVLFAITFPSPDDGDAMVLLFVVDITERRQAQDALLAAQSNLAHAARVATLGELSASIAHEVNQPLMAVLTSGEAALRWLRRDPPDLGEVDQSIGRIVAEGRRASEIVGRIRSFVRKAPAREERLTVGAVVEDAVLLVGRELSAARVQVSVAIRPDLPKIRGDRIQLQQILVNLMVNAGQAMAEQDGPRRLDVSACQDGPDDVMIVVVDTGPGIPTDDLPRVFEPFYTTRQQGMGMGLAICRTMAEAHGGRLTVESSAGEGARFRLRLPAAKEERVA